MYNRRIIAHKDSSQNVQERNGMLCYVTAYNVLGATELFHTRMHKVQTIDGVCSFVVNEDEITDACDGPEDCLGCAVCDPAKDHTTFWG